MIEDLLAPLAPREPTDEEIAGLLKRADRRTRRRRGKLATVAALATAAVVAVTQQHTPITAASILKGAAATAAQQPASAPWTGWRYVKSLDTRSTADYTVQRTEEEWVDSSWQGRLISTPKLVSGTIPNLALPGRRQGPADRRADQAIRVPAPPCGLDEAVRDRHAEADAQPVRRRRAREGPAGSASHRPGEARHPAARRAQGRPLDPVGQLEPRAAADPAARSCATSCCC